jgi:small nuclear ribonucleoprotein (snRNP)-like protein
MTESARGKLNRIGARAGMFRFEEFIGQEVVVDVASPYVYVGTLVGSDDKYLMLARADVHDLRDTNTTRELYVVDSRRYGVRTNRERVLVKLTDVVSLSALSDVIP